MNLSKEQLWERFQKYYREFPELGLALDVSRMSFPDDFFAAMEPRMQKAFADMDALEEGAIANPDENRMVGHYWLRNPALAPTTEIRNEIEQTVAKIKDFARRVHEGKIKGAEGTFKNILLIGIGGSALGPQFVSHALSHPQRDKLRLFVFDNTDPDGMDRVLAEIGSDLDRTLCVVISKSGGTKETRNGMLETKAAFESNGLSFAQHAVAVTQSGSELEKVAKDWIERFPMWDWVGGRTSELSAVGLLPAALQGFDIDEMLRGARECDAVTRLHNIHGNPASVLALIWFYSGNGKGLRDMVILPYKDRLELFSRYLQQLVMESLGKEKDLFGNTVHQGISVFGNKGSTDQHAYIQQLRDGIDNFFVTFIEVLLERNQSALEVDSKITSGDYLLGFFLGTRQALFEKGRDSLTVTIESVSPFSVGVLIALFERAVGLYASLISINAYHQPGVEAGKKTAAALLNLELKILGALDAEQGSTMTVEQLAMKIRATDQLEDIFKICEHLSANPFRNVSKVQHGFALKDRAYRRS